MNMPNLKLAIASATGINLPTLMLSRQLDVNQQPQPWLSHWDNEKRVRIVMHEDVAKAITPELDTLAYKMEKVAAHENVLEYTRVVVIIPSSVEMTF